MDLWPALQAVSSDHAVQVDDDPFFLNAGADGGAHGAHEGLRNGEEVGATVPPALTSEDTSGAPESRPSPTGLQVQSISLGYHPARPVIENLTAAITPGAVTMIVGPTPAGSRRCCDP